MQYIYNAIYLLEQNFLKKKKKKPKQVTHSLIRIFIKREMRGALIE